MPIREKKFKSELTNTISSFMDGKRRKASGLEEDDGYGVEFLSATDFIDQFKLMPNGLYPVQRFIVKLYYNIPLDDQNKTIRINTRPPVGLMNDNDSIREFTETEYLRYLYDNGRCNIREQDGKQRKELILALGRRSGKCLRLNSLIITDSGSIPVGDLVSHREVGWKPLDIKITKELGVQSRTNGGYYGGIQDVRDIKTYCGYEIGVTPEHRLKVLTSNGSIEWKYACDIQVGDYVGINRSNNLWPNNDFDCSGISTHTRNEFKSRTGYPVCLPDIVDARLGEFLGLLAGDGTWSSGKIVSKIQITGGCEQLRPHIESIFQHFLGRYSVFRKPPALNNTCAISPWHVQRDSVEFRSFLDKLGFRLNATKGDKSIPWVIFRSSKKVVSAFLCGLFEADGGMEKGNMISFSSHSEQLCKDVQSLLLNFGIVCRYTPKYNKRFDSTNYILNILGGNSRQIFCEEIGFITDRKNNILEDSLKSINQGCSDTESIPNLKNILRNLGDSIPKQNNTSGVSYRPRSVLKEMMGGSAKPGNKENISHNRLQRVVNYARENGADHSICDKLQYIIDCNYFWDPVISIKKDQAEVADISVPEGHEYVAQGMTNHNSEISSIFSSYELYKLMRRGNPQGYYGMPAGGEIRVLCVANDKEQASIVYGSIQGHIQSVDYFKTNVSASNQSLVRFRTSQDRKRLGEDTTKGSIVATFRSSVAKGLRGRGVICVILDEVAFFLDEGTSSAEHIYRAITPSLKQFTPRDPKDKHRPIASSDGRMILISSPNAKEGFFFRQYQQAMSGDRAASNSLVIQAPTWEVNPTLSHEDYALEFAKEPKSFMTEYGAEFSDRVRGFIEDHKDLEACIIPDLRPQVRGIPREPHWAGVDFALSGDGTAIALTHIKDGRIELAYHEVWYPKRSWKDANPHLLTPLVPYALSLNTVSRLDIDEIANWLSALSTRFSITQGVFDQWAGPVFEQVLHKKNLTQFSMRNFFPSETSQMWRTFQMVMQQKMLALYDYPLPEFASAETASMRHSPLIAELLELQMTSAGKNLISVEAPRIAGKHDDQSDALARSVHLVMESVAAHPGLLERGSRSMQLPNQTRGSIGHDQYYRLRNSMGGGVPKERRIPRGMPRVRLR